MSACGGALQAQKHVVKLGETRYGAPGAPLPATITTGGGQDGSPTSLPSHPPDPSSARHHHEQHHEKSS